jgi:hypothetical protein
MLGLPQILYRIRNCGVDAVESRSWSALRLCLVQETAASAVAERIFLSLTLPKSTYDRTLGMIWSSW